MHLLWIIKFFCVAFICMLTSSQVQAIFCLHSMARIDNRDHDSSSGGDASTVTSDISSVVQTIHEDAVAPHYCCYMTIADLRQQVEQRGQPETHTQLVIQHWQPSNEDARFSSSDLALTTIQLVRWSVGQTQHWQQSSWLDLALTTIQLVRWSDAALTTVQLASLSSDNHPVGQMVRYSNDNCQVHSTLHWKLCLTSNWSLLNKTHKRFKVTLIY